MAPVEDRDAVSELVEALLEGRHPPLSWIERWSAPGRDPVQVGWEHSAAPVMMLQLLCHRWPLFEEHAERAAGAAVDGCGGLRRLILPAPPKGPFSPDLTKFGPRLPIRLVHWLGDYAKGNLDRRKRIAHAIRQAVPIPPPLVGLTGRFAGAYAFGEKVVIHGQCGHGGYYLVGAPALGASLSDADDVLGRFVREALAGYQPNLPAQAPSDDNWMKPVLKAVGARSQRQLQEAGRHCWIEETATGSAIVPTYNGGNRGAQRGFTRLEDRAVRVGRDASDLEFGAALRRALECCS